MSTSPAAPRQGSNGAIKRGVEQLGAMAGGMLDTIYGGVAAIGGMAYLVRDATACLLNAAFRRPTRLGRPAIAEQMVRVGVRSIGIVMLVQVFIGAILAMQMAPTLESYGQLDKVANIVAIAVFRELGPLITAIVLSGFAGASIAAEIGAMVEAEEIKALKAHALDPIRFLIVPRLLATTVMIVGLAVVADVIGVAGGLFTSWTVLGIDPDNYLSATQAALTLKDFITGLVKSAVFGLLISMIACYEGLSVSGGAEGVGRATTATVVKSIVALIGMDAVFTAIFFAFGI